MKKIDFPCAGAYGDDIDITIFTADDTHMVESSITSDSSVVVKVIRQPAPEQDVLHVLVHIETGFGSISEE